MKKICNWHTFIPVLILGILSLVCYTLHDICTAEGVGLYWAILWGNEKRLPFDIAVDVIGILLFLAVLIIPCCLLKHRKTDSLFRIMVVYLAFMPVISPGYLVHLFDGHDLWKVEFDWQAGLNNLCDLAQIIIPLGFILGFIYKSSGFCIKRWQKIMFITMPILFAVVMLLPELSKVCMQLVYYSGVLIAFDWWESLYSKTEKYEKVIVGILFGVFFCSGCLRMLDLLHAYHL